MEARHVSHPSPYPRMENAGMAMAGRDKRLEVGETLFPYLNDEDYPRDEREIFLAQECTILYVLIAKIPI